MATLLVKEGPSAKPETELSSESGRAWLRARARVRVEVGAKGRVGVEVGARARARVRARRARGPRGKAGELSSGLEGLLVAVPAACAAAAWQ